ncbi:MAG: type VI secretion system baseplate subunit TssK [Pseudomonadota bacterium]|nr:type VI secretion system baseplate subunit TssK [Pseudomonadota bacterium]
MSWQRRVVWTEGMFLRPQHFQQQERYLEFYANGRSGPMGSHAWGFEELVLDADALKLGKFAIRQARGLFPDGTPFSLPAQGDPPAPLDVSGEARGQRVLLALPLRRPDVAEIALGADEDLTRVRVADREVVDAIAMGSPPALIQIGDLRLRLLLESDLTDGWMTLGLARIAEKRPDNALILDEAYIPPTLSLRSCAPLESFVREMEGLLHQRGEALAGRISQPGRGGISDFTDFLLLEVVNRWEPRIRHVAQQNAMHAERLYAMLLELGGDLATFARESRRPIDYPVYDHDDAQNSFQPLMADLRRSMSMSSEQNAIAIELTDRGHSVYVGIMPSVELVRTASFVLAVSAELPADLVRTRFPMQVKIGPVEKIRDLVHLQLPGVTLRPMPVAPRQIPYHAGFNYFELDTKNDLWRQLERSGGLAMFIAGDFPGLQFQLWAIRA